MKDNVIILGAGASVDANIPVLSSFVQAMWEIAQRNTFRGNKLSKADEEVFNNAIKVRDELDHYHGRANFNDKNIEDILSILTFNLYEGKQSDRNRLKWIIKAIERTIELSCEVEFDDTKNIIQTNGDSVYREFWQALLKHNSSDIPALISFNYDLVLERALFQVMNNYEYDENKKYLDYVLRINYYYKSLEYLTYSIESQGYYGNSVGRDNFGSHMTLSEHKKPDIDIKLLKLHGSLNFPKTKVSSNSVTNTTENPFILPPVFNKNNSQIMESIWKEALSNLRKAKNIIFVGYSLPQTDIYMQYFFKSSLGPNNNLNKIFVFDPVLYSENTDKVTEMKTRYKNCFAPQIHDQIDFNPVVRHYEKHLNGTFRGFVEMLSKNPSDLLF